MVSAATCQFLFLLSVFLQNIKRHYTTCCYITKVLRVAFESLVGVLVCISSCEHCLSCGIMDRVYQVEDVVQNNDHSCEMQSPPKCISQWPVEACQSIPIAMMSLIWSLQLSIPLIASSSSPLSPTTSNHGAISIPALSYKRLSQTISSVACSPSVFRSRSSVYMKQTLYSSYFFPGVQLKRIRIVS